MLNKEDIQKSLLDYVDEIEDVETSQDNDHFHIENMDQANYYIKKYKELDQEEQTINETAKEYLNSYKEKVDSWQNKVLEPIQNKKNYYEYLLKEYASNQLQGTKKKSIKLIEGTLGFRKSNPNIIYDENEMLEYLINEEYDRLYKTSYKIDKRELQSLTEIKDGELYLDDNKLDFVQIEEREPSFSIK